MPKIKDLLNNLKNKIIELALKLDKALNKENGIHKILFVALYVNYSEIYDEDYGISGDDKKLNREFYKV